MFTQREYHSWSFLKFSPRLRSEVFYKGGYFENESSLQAFIRRHRASVYDVFERVVIDLAIVYIVCEGCVINAREMRLLSDVTQPDTGE